MPFLTATSEVGLQKEGRVYGVGDDAAGEGLSAGMGVQARERKAYRVGSWVSKERKGRKE